jgi:hypothetical protein
VPFAERLADAIPPVATRLRRDFTTLLTLLKPHAALLPVDRIKPGDAVAIRKHKIELMALCDYVETK